MSARSPFPDDLDDDYDDEDYYDDEDDLDEEFDDDEDTDGLDGEFDDADDADDDLDDNEDDYLDDDDDGDDEGYEADDEDAEYDDEDDYDEDDYDEDYYDDEDDLDDDEDDPADEWNALSLELDFDPDDEDVDPDDDDPAPQDEADKDAIIKSLRRENAARRKKLNDFREESMGAVEEAVATVLTQLADSLQIDTGDDIDADELVNTVNELVAANERRATKAERDLAIYKAATPLGMDMAALADSKSFTAIIDALDPADPNYAAEVAKAVEAAAAANPHYKAAPQVPRSGGDFTGGTTAPALADTSVDAFRRKRQARRAGM